MSEAKLQSDIVEIKLAVQKIAIIQENQAKDLAHHIARTDGLQDLVEKQMEIQRSCPARINSLSNKNLINRAKDISVILGLVVVILKLWGLI